MPLAGSDLTEGTWPSISLDAMRREPFDLESRAAPGHAVAGEALHLRLEYAPRGFDLSAGTVIAIAVPRIWRKHLGMAFRQLHDEFDTDEERHPGGSFCLVSVRVPQASDLVAEREIVPGGFYFVIHLVLREGALHDGETLTVYLADPQGPKVQVPKTAQVHPLRTLIRPAGQDFFQEVTEPPAVVVRGGPAARLRLRCPGIVPRGEEVVVRATAVDGVGENPATGYEGAVHVWRRGEDRDGGMLTTHTSEARVTEVRLAGGEEQFAHFQALDEAASLAGRSNPVGRPDEFGGWNVYFGDIHCHCKPADAFGSMEEAYEYGYWCSGLDFCTVAHQQNSANHLFTQERWHEYLDINDRYDAMADFATVVGCENYIRAGHRIAYFRSSDQARQFQVTRARGEEGYHETPEELWALLRDFEALTVPHHTRYISPADWSRALDPMERCVEICSRWGSSEIGGPHSVQQALRLGHRLGFVGGTDNHLGQPGNGPFGVNEGRGITAVLAPELTREALYDAMAARRCYATSGERMLLYFALDDEPMGSELSGYQGTRSFTIRAAGTQPLATVELLRSNHVIARVEPHELTSIGVLEDDEPLDALFLEPAFADQPPFCFYYVRVRQVDGEVAWSSPIWLTR